MARAEVALGGSGSDRLELRVLRAADVHDVLTAGVEAAPARRVEQRRRLAGNLDEPLDRDVEPRQRAEQPPGIRVLRRAEENVDGKVRCSAAIMVRCIRVNFGRLRHQIMVG